MTPLLFAAVAAAGGVGAALRYLLDIAVTRIAGPRLPWGILVVNVTGAFALGVLSAALAETAGSWVVGVGLLGGYTTFSSVAVSTALLASDDRQRAGITYAVGTFACSVAAALAGLGLGALFA